MGIRSDAGRGCRWGSVVWNKVDKQSTFVVCGVSGGAASTAAFMHLLRFKGSSWGFLGAEHLERIIDHDRPESRWGNRRLRGAW